MKRCTTTLGAMVLVTAGACADRVSPAVIDVELDDANGIAVQYRDGADGAWRYASRTSPTSRHYAIEATDDYEVIAQCEDGLPAQHATMLVGTVGDGDHVAIDCVDALLLVGNGHAIRGQVAGTGEVDVANVPMTGTQRAFEVAPLLPPGSTYYADVAAVGGGNIVLFRGGPLDRDVDAGTLDVARGAPLATIPVTSTTAGAALSAFTRLSLDGQPVWEDTSTLGTAGTARIAPVALLGPSDREDIEVSLGGAQFATAPVDGAPLALDFLAQPVATVGGAGPALTALWTSLPDRATRVEVFAGGQSIVALRGWLDANGATSLTFDTGAPGFDRALVAGDATWFAAIDDSSSTIYRSLAPVQ